MRSAGLLASDSQHRYGSALNASNGVTVSNVHGMSRCRATLCHVSATMCVFSALFQMHTHAHTIYIIACTPQ